MLSQLNRGRLPEQLRFSAGGDGDGGGLKAYAEHRIGELNESNIDFLKYLTTDYAKMFILKIT